MTVNVNLLSQYMGSGLNIIITGEAGTGKTTMLEQASKELGWKLKYFSTPTLDVFSDLIGIPVPNHGRKTIEYYRPRDLDDADVVFFDELNRGDLMVLNAVFEIIQFRTINGEKLDRLKSCVAAVNPVVDGYSTRKLDIALLDRFDLQLESDPNPSYDYFRKRYGELYAKAGLHLYKEYQVLKSDGAPLPYLSPRRLDKMLAIFQKFPVIETLRGVIDDGEGVIDLARWAFVLEKSRGQVGVPIEGDIGIEIARAREYLQTNIVHKDFIKGEVLKICHIAKTSGHRAWPLLKLELMANLNRYALSVDDIQFWEEIIKGSTAEEMKMLTTGWSSAKTSVATKLS